VPEGTFGEAEGVFKIINNCIYIGISQSTNNIQSLYQIKKIFGLGLVKTSKGRFCGKAVKTWPLMGAKILPWAFAEGPG
jgi:hypothetical protein